MRLKRSRSTFELEQSERPLRAKQEPEGPFSSYDLEESERLNESVGSMSVGVSKISSNKFCLFSAPGKRLIAHLISFSKADSH